MICTHIRRSLALSLAGLMLAGLMAAPVTAHAQDAKGKKKGDTGTVVIGTPIITDDPTRPTPPPKPPKKEKK